MRKLITYYEGVDIVTVLQNGREMLDYMKSNDLEKKRNAAQQKLKDADARKDERSLSGIPSNPKNMNNLSKAKKTTKRTVGDIHHPARASRPLDPSTEIMEQPRHIMEMCNLKSALSQMQVSADQFEALLEERNRKEEYCDKILKILENASGTSNYREGDTFDVQWSCQFGHTVNTKGLRSFEESHGFDSTMGVHDFQVEKLLPWQQEVLRLGEALWMMTASTECTGDGMLIATVTLMTPASDIGRHRDGRDIGPQMVVSMGDFTGGMLRCFNLANTHYVDVSTRNNPTLCDGRLDHYVHKVEDGRRFSMILYRMNDWTSYGPSTVVDIVPQHPNRVSVSNLSPGDLGYREGLCPDVAAAEPRCSNRNGDKPNNITKKKRRKTSINVTTVSNSARQLDRDHAVRTKASAEWYLRIETFAAHWVNGQNIDSPDDIDFCSAAITRINNHRYDILPTQDDRPSIRVVIDVCGRIFRDGPDMLEHAHHIARCLQYSISTHAVNRIPKRDAIGNITQMQRGEFLQIFGSYSNATTWEGTLPEANPKLVFKDVCREFTLHKIRVGGSYPPSSADARLIEWSAKLSLDMTVTQFESWLDEKAPYVIHGPLMRIFLVVAFSHLGIIKRNEDLKNWLPNSLTRFSGSVKVCQRVIGMSKRDSIQYMKRTARRLGMHAYNFENVLCKLSVAYFAPLGIYELIA
jgi:hypothetical protein